MSTASLPTSSRLRFIHTDGAVLEAPREWQEEEIELDAPPTSESLRSLRLQLNGQPLAISVQWRDGEPRVTARWPLSGAGRYRLTLSDGALTEHYSVNVLPR